MIYSLLAGTDTCYAYPSALRKAFGYLLRTDFLSAPVGRYDILGENMFVNVMDMTTHPIEGSHPEVHKRYIDLMYWPEGGERIGYAPYLGTEPIYETHPENDITLLENVANENFFATTAGQFCVFFPWDAHRPGIMLGSVPATSRKCVVKISMKLLEE